VIVTVTPLRATRRLHPLKLTRRRRIEIVTACRHYVNLSEVCQGGMANEPQHIMNSQGFASRSSLRTWESVLGYEGRPVRGPKCEAQPRSYLERIDADDAVSGQHIVGSPNLGLYRPKIVANEAAGGGI
jgi:hypothetical protein